MPKTSAPWFPLAAFLLLPSAAVGCFPAGSEVDNDGNRKQASSSARTVQPFPRDEDYRTLTPYCGEARPLAIIAGTMPLDAQATLHILSIAMHYKETFVIDKDSPETSEYNTAQVQARAVDVARRNQQKIETRLNQLRPGHRITFKWQFPLERYSLLNHADIFVTAPNWNWLSGQNDQMSLFEMLPGVIGTDSRLYLCDNRLQFSQIVRNEMDGDPSQPAELLPASSAISLADFQMQAVHAKANPPELGFDIHIPMSPQNHLSSIRIASILFIQSETPVVTLGFKRKTSQIPLRAPMPPAAGR